MIGLKEIEEWVDQNAEGIIPEIPLSPTERGHVAMCLQHICWWYYENRPIGSFLTAVVKNDLLMACLRADDVNRKALFLYALFLSNKIPSDYQAKANK